MNITCAVCQEIFRPSDDIYSTQCGHAFHLMCIRHWFQQAKKTCPTCREPATMSSTKSLHSIHRMYFDISRNSEVPQNVGVLQDEIDNLTIQLKTRDRELRTLKDGYDANEKQNKGLKAEIRNLECSLEKNKETIFQYKEQLRRVKSLEEDNSKLRKQVIALNNTMEQMQNMKDLVTGSFSEVDTMLKNQTDPKTLQIYCSTLKKHFEDHTLKFRKEREKTKRLQQEVVDLTKQRDKYVTKCEQYAKELEFNQNKANQMPAQFKLEDIIAKGSTKSKYTFPLKSPRKSEKHKIPTLEEDTENCTPKKMRRRTVHLESGSEGFDASTPKKNIAKEKAECRALSPYLQAKGGVASLRLNLMKRNCGSSSEHAVFAKKPKLLIVQKKTPHPFDGMGGRSRDVEPSQSPPKSKLKRPTEHPVRPKKPKLLGNFRTLDDFVDLTGNTP